MRRRQFIKISSIAALFAAAVPSIPAILSTRKQDSTSDCLVSDDQMACYMDEHPMTIYDNDSGEIIFKSSDGYLYSDWRMGDKRNRYQLEVPNCDYVNWARIEKLRYNPYGISLVYEQSSGNRLHGTAKSYSFNIHNLDESHFDESRISIEAVLHDLKWHFSPLIW